MSTKASGMKNILAVIDILNFSETQLDLIQYITRLMKGKLTIVLLEIIPPPFPAPLPGVLDALFYGEQSMENNIRERQLEMAENTEKLRAACASRGMGVTLHTYAEAPLEAVIIESRFADVLLVTHDLSLSAIRGGNPPDFIHELLLQAQCPVLTLPDDMQTIKETVLAYNGSYSSMYAIRAFFHLFPALALRKVKVVYVTENGEDAMPDEARLKHYLNGFCTKTEYVILQGGPSKSLLASLQDSKHTLVTFGAYGRSRASLFFNSSTADDALRLNHIYTFITHH